MKPSDNLFSDADAEHIRDIGRQIAYRENKRGIKLLTDDDTLDHVKLSDLPPARIDPDESDPALVVLTCIISSILILVAVFLFAMAWSDSEEKRRPAPERVQDIDMPAYEPWSEVPTPEQLFQKEMK